MEDAALGLVTGGCTEHVVNLSQLIASTGNVGEEDQAKELAYAR